MVDKNDQMLGLAVDKLADLFVLMSEILVHLIGMVPVLGLVRAGMAGLEVEMV